MKNGKSTATGSKRRRLNGASASKIYDPPARGLQTFSTQQITRMWVPGALAQIVATNGSGVNPLIAGALTTDPTSNVTSWSSKYAKIFEEYRVVAMKVRICTSGSSSPAGPFFTWWDEQVTTLPTYTTGPLSIQEKNTTIRNLGMYATGATEKSTYCDHWKNKDFLDDQFQVIGSAPAGKATWKLYADTQTTGTAVTSGNTYLTVQPLYLIEFRGFVAV